MRWLGLSSPESRATVSDFIFSSSSHPLTFSGCPCYVSVRLSFCFTSLSLSLCLLLTIYFFLFLWCFVFLLFEELIAESLDARIEEKAEEVYKRKRIEEYVGEKGQKTRSEWVKSFTSDQFVVNRDLLRNFKAPSPEQIRKMPLPQKRLSTN